MKKRIIRSVLVLSLIVSAQALAGQSEGETANVLQLPQNYLSRLPSGLLSQIGLAIEQVGYSNPVIPAVSSETASDAADSSVPAPSVSGISDFNSLLGVLRQNGDTRSFEEEIAIFQRAKHLHILIVDMVDIPAVTQEEADQLVKTLTALGRSTMIRNAIPAFRASNAAVTIGLWRAVMGSYPAQPDRLVSKQDADEVHSPLIHSCLAKMWNQTQLDWDQDSDLPVDCITLDEKKDFVKKLNQITGRNFKVPSPDQNEYLKRGRIKNPDGTFGSIATTGYVGDMSVPEKYDFLSRLSHGVREDDSIRCVSFHSSNPYDAASGMAWDVDDKVLSVWSFAPLSDWVLPRPLRGQVPRLDDEVRDWEITFRIVEDMVAPPQPD